MNFYSSIKEIYFNSHQNDYYLCNNIKKKYAEGNYEHPKIRTQTAGKIRRSAFFYWKIENWPMYANSTLVTPIRCLQKHNRTTENDQTTDDWIGFLCINSKFSYVFHEVFSVEMAATFSDVLYLALDKAKKSNNISLI